MKSKEKILRIASKFNISNIFDYIPIDRCLLIIQGNKKLYKKLDYDLSINKNFYKFKKIVNPSYDSIEKYINMQENKNNIYFNSILSNPFLMNEKLFYKGINCLSKNISIDISKNIFWEILIKNITNIRLEINPSIIEYSNNLGENKRTITINLLRKFKRNIKEINFNSFNGEFEINFKIRQNIKNFLSSIFDNRNENKINNNCYVNKISFKNNSIISVLDINNILIEIGNIIYNDNANFNIETFNIDSNTANNNIKNIYIFIKEKIPNIKSLVLNKFNFINERKNNNKNSAILSDLFGKLKFLEKIDLINSKCDNKSLKEIFNKNNIKNLHLKELKVKIKYGDEMINWHFLDKFIDSLEFLEIEMIFPYNKINTIANKICFDYNNINTKELFFIINKMQKLKKLKLIGEYLNNYDLNYLQKNLIDFTYSFYILNSDMVNNHFYKPSLLNVFKYYDKMKSLSLIYNYPKSYDDNESYKGIDFLLAKEKEKFYKNSIFDFPKNLSVLKFDNFIDFNFLNYYLIPLLLKNKDKLYQIREIRLNNCFLEENQFKIFLGLLPSLINLDILSINNNNILFNYINTIFINAPNLIKLDISNNDYNENMLLNEKFLYLSENIPNNLINLKISNKKVPISHKAIIILKEYFGDLLDYENFNK